MVHPVRLRLSRAKGFDLQAFSLATNGLTAVNVARPTMWGNPYKVGDLIEVNGERIAIGSAAHACTLFREDVLGHYLRVAALRAGPEDCRRGGVAAEQWIKDASALRGKNLACWCKSGPCHADVLLAFANMPICEAA